VEKFAFICVHLRLPLPLSSQFLRLSAAICGSTARTLT
jgi:hypothetical protein